ncbi:MAG: hypothetical protein LUC50_02420 [Ruminococcus sp.]|nr:hypothetical protein [Ruminococcus sp.]
MKQKRFSTILLTICITIIVICLAIVILGRMYLKNRQTGESQQMEASTTELVTEAEAEEETEAETEAPTEAETEAPTEAETESPQTKKAAIQAAKEVQEIEEVEPVTEPAENLTIASGENGTTSVNLCNGGFVASDGTGLYFRGDDGYLYYSASGNGASTRLLNKEI